MKIGNMEELFLAEIEDLYDCEKRLTTALPKMANASTSPELKKAFESHLQETHGHVERLEKVFSGIAKDPKAGSSKAIKGLIEEGEEMIDNTQASSLRDAGIIAAANRVEHYEIAAYGSARTFAQSLGLDGAVSLLAQTLEEEKNADKKLTQLAETVNDDALRAAPAEQRSRGRSEKLVRRFVPMEEGCVPAAPRTIALKSSKKQSKRSAPARRVQALEKG